MDNFQELCRPGDFVKFREYFDKEEGVLLQRCAVAGSASTFNPGGTESSFAAPVLYYGRRGVLGLCRL